MNLLYLSAIIAFLCDIALATFVFLNNSRSAINRYFSLFLLAYAGWIFGDFFILLTPLRSFPLIGIKIAHIGAVFIPLFFIQFVSRFIHKQCNRFITWTLISTGLIFEVLLLFTKVFIQNAYVDSNMNLVVLPGPAYIAFVVQLSILFVGIHIYLFTKYSEFHLEIQQRISYFFYSSAIVGLTALCYVPFIYEIYSFRLDNILLIGYFASLAYAITKSSLLDVRVAIHKGVATLISVMIVLIGLILSAEFIRNHIHLASVGVPLIGLLSAVGFKPMCDFWITTTRRVFLRGYYDPARALGQITQCMVSTISREDTFDILAQQLDEILESKTAYRIMRLVKNNESENSGYSLREVIESPLGNEISLFPTETDWILYFASHPQPTMWNQLPIHVQSEFSNAAGGMVLPISSKMGFEGLIIIGIKDRGDTYTPNDIAFLETVQHLIVAIFDRIYPYEELAILNRTLAEKVQEQVAELERNREFLEKASDQMALVTFAKGIAHEIRNPVGIIRTGIESILKNENPTEGVKKYLDIVITYIDRTLAMTTKIMDTGTPQPHTTCELSKLITEIEALISPKCREENIKFVVNTPYTPLLRADGFALQRAIMNVVLNAIEAQKNQPSDKCVMIETAEIFIRRLTGQDAAVRIIVRDAGPGISDETKAKLFDAFYTTKNDNHGLGLSIAAKTIADHNGVMDVIGYDTQLGGARFHLDLPVLETE